MTNDVTITYSEYGSNPIIDKVEFEMIQDIMLKLNCDNNNKTISITMADMIADNTELEGSLTSDKLTLLIRILSQLRNQIK